MMINGIIRLLYTSTKYTARFTRCKTSQTSTRKRKFPIWKVRVIHIQTVECCSVAPFGQRRPRRISSAVR